MRPGPYAGVIYKFIERALRNEPLVIYGDREQTRDFVYVEDVAEANLKALKARKPGVYNIGTGKPITINELAKKIIELTHSRSRIIYDKPRPGDIKHSHADITKAKNQLGWKPKTTLEQGLIKTIEYMSKS